MSSAVVTTSGTGGRDTPTSVASDAGSSSQKSVSSAATNGTASTTSRPTSETTTTRKTTTNGSITRAATNLTGRSTVKPPQSVPFALQRTLTVVSRLPTPTASKPPSRAQTPSIPPTPTSSTAPTKLGGTVAGGKLAGTASARSAATLLTIQKECDRYKKLAAEQKKQLAMASRCIHHSGKVVDGLSVVVRYMSEDLDAFSHPIIVARLASADKDSTAASEAHKEHVEGLLDQIAFADARESELRDEVRALESEIEKAKGRARVEREKLLEMHQLEMKLAAREHESALRILREGEEELHSRLYDKCQELAEAGSEKDKLEERIKELEGSLRQDKDKRVRALRDKCLGLEQEVSSLNSVLEIKDERIRAQQSQIMELELRVEELPSIRENNKILKQKLEQVSFLL